MKKIKIVSLALAVMLFASMGGCKKEEQKQDSEKNTVTETQTDKKVATGEKNSEDKTKEEKVITEDEQTNKSEIQQGKTAEEVVPMGGDGTASEPEKIYTPTFMYFIADTDENFAETNQVIERLKNEYNGKVNFDVRNVTQDPAQLDNFPVADQTPALIMLDTSNNISNFLFMNGNYDDLKAAIDAALQ